jgi:hypothetical protein
MGILPINHGLEARATLILLGALIIAFSATFVSLHASGAEETSQHRDITQDVSIPGNRAWTPTGIQVKRGNYLTIVELPGSEEQRSSVAIRKGWAPFARARANVTASGSYTLMTRERDFPLPAFVEDGRFPAYCLLGRIGENGEPFYVGPQHQSKASQAGELWLGINDPDPAKNKGEFLCKVRVDNPTSKRLDPWPRGVVSDEGEPHPIADANVVIFFIDGLRPDVAIEMAQMGHMPTFRDLFMDGGTYVENAFSVLPSLTDTNFASMMTGTFSDKHGSKTNYYFDREKQGFVSNLNKYSYQRLAKQIRRRGVKALYDYFPDSFGAGALPVQPRSPKVLQVNLLEWAHRSLNVANHMSEVRKEIDKAQARFGLDLASCPNVRVMVIWLPKTDVDSERWHHGQFGGTRGRIAEADEHMARIVRQLKRRGRFEETYFVLFSDHGTVGGNGFINKKFNLDREILHAHFRLNTAGYYGRFRCPGTPRDHLAMISDTDGAVQVSLPYIKADSGNLSRPNFLVELQNYELADGTRVRALELLTEYTAQGRIRREDLDSKPVDFAVARLDGDTVFVQRTAKSQAFITRRLRPDGELEFRYEPVRDYLPGGAVERITSRDPLRYLDSPAFSEAVVRQGATVEEWLDGFHTGREWLEATAATEYPGCIDAISRFFRYDDRLAGGNEEHKQPDVLLFANRGWTFMPKVMINNRIQEIAGTRHGMAFREATQICMFFAGPGIRQGYVIKEAHRIVDILPTVLTIMSRDWKGNGIDGVPIDGIWESHESDEEDLSEKLLTDG